VLGTGGQVGHFLGVAKAPRQNLCHAQRQAGTGEEALHPVAVFGVDASGLAACFVVQQPGFVREGVRNRLAAQQPVVALEQHHKIVAAHTADKVAPCIAVRHHQAGSQADHLVAAPVAIVVVEGLEVVEVRIAGHKRVAAGQQALDVHADRNIARQEGQRVGVACRLDARLRHGAHQLVPGTQAHVAPVVGHDEAIAQVALVL
jgi:hypothetical protein